MGNNHSSPKRRNTDDQRQNLQYRPDRGDPIPVSNADSDLRRAGDLDIRRGNRYPKDYRNREGDDDDRLFHEWEAKTEEFCELPTGVNPRYDRNRRPTGRERMQEIENNLHPNDRRTVVRNPPNNPGVYRAIANERPAGGYDPAGLIYHPEGNVNGFVRAPMEPLNRRGRQHLNRYADDFEDDRNRSVTWPNREEDASTFASHEQRYTVERRRGNNQQRQNGRRM